MSSIRLSGTIRWQFSWSVGQQEASWGLLIHSVKFPSLIQSSELTPPTVLVPAQATRSVNEAVWEPGMFLYEASSCLPSQAVRRSHTPLGNGLLVYRHPAGALPSVS